MAQTINHTVSRGSIAIVSCVILSAIMLSLVVSITAVGIFLRTYTFHFERNVALEHSVHGCLNIALVRIVYGMTKDDQYKGGEYIVIDDISCFVKKVEYDDGYEKVHVTLEYVSMYSTTTRVFSVNPKILLQ